MEGTTTTVDRSDEPPANLTLPPTCAQEPSASVWTQTWSRGVSLGAVASTARRDRSSATSISIVLSLRLAAGGSRPTRFVDQPSAVRVAIRSPCGSLILASDIACSPSGIVHAELTSIPLLCSGETSS